MDLETFHQNLAHGFLKEFHLLLLKHPVQI